MLGGEIRFAVLWPLSRIGFSTFDLVFVCLASFASGLALAFENVSRFWVLRLAYCTRSRG
jgi:hypothetical protein